MSSSAQPQVVQTYLADLRSALSGVPDEVTRGIVSGIAEGLDGLDAPAAAARIVELGDPAFIAAEARAGVTPSTAEPDATSVRAGSRRWYVVVTILFYCVGGLVVPVIGWIAGVLFIWTSSLW